MTHSVNTPVIDWPAAQTAVAAAVQAAQAMGARVNVALVDAGGVLAGFLRMPGAPLHSIDIAIDKAYTAVSFGLPTARWTEVLQSHSAAVRDGLVQRPRFVAFGGGLPIVEDGRCIGAIGVSGGSEQQDEEIAHAGLVALGLHTA
ncbi:heme-binding protein [Hydrogenophaga sp. 2FB]|uniref:GlcG/HbpS family heme-binding protein n=1 Tax=Hydrogenophaga sp. 2FB TaxID=2502187 RepID=UPI0010FA53A1|nr:heme-binding protein [Hydrogenophaga sp. 2FB]